MSAIKEHPPHAQKQVYLLQLDILLKALEAEMLFFVEDFKYILCSLLTFNEQRSGRVERDVTSRTLLKIGILSDVNKSTGCKNYRISVHTELWTLR